MYMAIENTLTANSNGQSICLNEAEMLKIISHSEGRGLVL